MAQFWTATAVTTTSGSAFISVQTGDDVALISSNSFLQVGTNQFVEVKTVNTSASPQTIELFVPWNAATASGQSAIAAPTKAEIKAAADEIRALRVTYEGIAGNISETASPNTIVQRDANSRVKIATPAAAEDAVNLGYLGTAANKDITTSQVDTTAGRLLKVGDFGIGSQGGTVSGDNADLLVEGGIYRVTNTMSNIAFVGTSTIIVSRSFNVVSQIQVDGSQMWIRRSTTTGSSWQAWWEVFTSLNSVNPLDFGVGGISKITLTDANNALIGGYQSSGQITQETAVAANFPDLGITGSQPVWWNVLTHGGAATRLTQEATEVFAITGGALVNVPRKFLRNKQDSLWDDWVEVFTTGNLESTPLTWTANQAFTGSVRAELPNDFWSATLSGYNIAGLGIMGTQGSNRVGMTHNIYRNNVGATSIIGVAGNTTTGSIFEFDSTRLYWRAGVPSGNTIPTLELEIRSNGDGIFYDGGDIYHEGNSVNPLDFGIGNLSAPPIASFENNMENGHYSCVLSTVGGSPDTQAYFGTILVNKASDNNGVTFLVSRVTSSATQQKHWFGTRSVATGAVSWAEIFTEKNSVNPLDFGIGADSDRTTTEVVDINNLLLGGNYRHGATALNRPPNATASNGSITVIPGGANSRVTQLGFNDSIIDNQMYIRMYNGTIWSAWREFYTSANTNFNVFGGLQDSDFIATGYVASAGTILLALPINATVQPTSITVAAGSVFDIVLLSNTPLVANVTFTLSSVSCQKIAWLVVTAPAHGLTIGQSVVLQQKTTTSKITVNF